MSKRDIRRDLDIQDLRRDLWHGFHEAISAGGHADNLAVFLLGLDTAALRK